MATVTTNCIEQIGEAAGQIWHTLNQGGRMSFTKLLKEVDLPKDLALQAIGWLAREEKIEIEEQARGKTIGLK